MAEAKTSARRIDAAARRRKALQLRMAGANFQQIADTPTDPANGDMRPMYSSRQRAHEAVTTALKEIQKEIHGDAKELRTLELARLDSLLVALWPLTRPTRTISEKCPCGCEQVVTITREPDMDAVDRVLKIVQQRSKLLGLDMKGAESDASSGVSLIMNLMGALGAAVGDSDPFADSTYARPND